MEILKRKKLALVFLVIGVVGGFLYWKFIGCTSGTCAIKSVWYWSTLWGAVMGYLVGDMLNDLVLKIKSKKASKNAGEV
ncbi:MAG TPA: DUF6132 family protein [Draconibacterium sp.]|nr:DUF6132 family protein [Draconibacterium sp.]